MNWLRKIYDRIVLEITYRKKIKKDDDEDPYIYK
jgi:hypothetical protein